MPIVREPVTAMITGLPRLEPPLPVAWLDPLWSSRHDNKEVPFRIHPAAGGSDWIPCARASAPSSLLFRRDIDAALAI